ncbi:right-handed parallel beta-helix repeat-containing protein [Macrococcus animalis]|uniref:right-handed parallel beta-helix repeat-containing protein n=1 Tax=Macrococcus animalis TaxID=3395467 RepID=UPI0039BE5B77
MVIELNPTPSIYDRTWRLNENENWDILSEIFKQGLESVMSDEVIKATIDEWLTLNQFKPKEAVATKADLPIPAEKNELRGVLDENSVYVFDGVRWVKQANIDFNALNAIQQSVNDKVGVSLSEKGVYDGENITDTLNQIIATDNPSIIIVDGNYIIDKDFTVPSNVTLRFDTGASLQVDANLRVLGSIEAAQEAVFTGTGTINGVVENNKYLDIWFDNFDINNWQLRNYSETNQTRYVDGTFYVSCLTGSDTNNGTIDKPFKTLEYAKQKVVDLITAGTTLPQIKVYIRGGNYNNKQPLNYTDNSNVVVKFQAYPQEEVNFFGNVHRVTKFNKDTINGIECVSTKLPDNLFNYNLNSVFNTKTEKRLKVANNMNENYDLLRSRGVVPYTNSTNNKIMNSEFESWTMHDQKLYMRNWEIADTLKVKFKPSKMGANSALLVDYTDYAGGKDFYQLIANGTFATGDTVTLQFVAQGIVGGEKVYTRILGTGVNGAETVHTLTTEPKIFTHTVTWTDAINLRFVIRGDSGQKFKLTKVMVNKGSAMTYERRNYLDTRVSVGSEINASMDLSRARLVLFHNWTNTVRNIFNYDFSNPSDVTVTMDGTYGLEHQYSHVGGMIHYIENVREFLTKKGEYFIDRNEKKLYYIPLDNETEYDFVIPLGYRMIEITNAQKVEFIGINFKYGDWNEELLTVSNTLQAAADSLGWIKLINSSNINISYCNFVGSPETCIVTDKTSHFNTFTHNRMTESSMGGISIRSGSNDNVIDNNDVFEIGNVVKHGVPLLIMGTNDLPSARNKVTNNKFHDVPWCGMFMSWGWVTYEKDYDTKIATPDTIVDNNHIYNCGRYENKFRQESDHLGDSGGIFFAGNCKGSKISNNVIHHIGSNRWMSNGLYFDFGTSGLEIFNNIIYNVTHFSITNRGGLVLKDGKVGGGMLNNKVYNNIFVGPMMWYLEQVGSTYAPNGDQQSEFHHNIVFDTIDQKLLSTISTEVDTEQARDMRIYFPVNKAGNNSPERHHHNWYFSKGTYTHKVEQTMVLDQLVKGGQYGLADFQARSGSEVGSMNTVIGFFTTFLNDMRPSTLNLDKGNLKTLGFVEFENMKL